MLTIGSCRNKTEEINQLVGQKVPQEDRAQDVVFIYSENGKVKSRLFSKEFIRNELAKPPYIDMNKGLKMESFNDSNAVESTLTARYARYYEREGNVVIRDSIVIVNKKGERLETEELIWNQKLKKFFTEKPVSIKTATQLIYGDGLEANEDFTWYQITNIKGILQVRKDEVPE
jgi:LPS export ABC transporter protein LptC